MMAGKIFISYRRDDAAGDARGIRDALAASFGHANIFMDVDDLLAGQRFDKELSKALDDCDVLIAVIGPRWMDLLRSRTQSGERDYVREEIASALQRGIVVIPTRVGLEGRMSSLPRGSDLPNDIRDLVLHQKHDVTHERFGRDVTDLITAIAATYARFERDGDDLPAVIRTVESVSSPQRPPPLQQTTHHQQEAYTGPNVDHVDEYFDDKQPRRGRRWLSFAMALVTTVGVSGPLVYMLVTADPGFKSAIEPYNSRDLRGADKKLSKRLGEDAALKTPQPEPQTQEGEEKSLEPRTVKTVHIPPLVQVPGITLQNLQLPQPEQPRVKVPGITLVQPPPSKGLGYVAVLSTHKSQIDALKAFADMAQKYPDVLSGKTPDVEEANLGEKGVWYRVVVGQLGSREAAVSVCGQLKTAGHADCWVKQY